MKQWISLVTFSLFSLSVFAYTECEVVPNKVWLNLKQTNTVWICFENAACVYKTKDSVVTDARLDRMYSTAMAAISRGSKLQIRYPEDNGICSELIGTTRNDVEGIWFLK